LIIGKQEVFTKLKNLNAIKLFKIKLQKYKGSQPDDIDDFDDIEDMDEERERRSESKKKRNNVEKIIFNCRVGLFLMCQEVNSLKEIFKMKGMKNNINDQLRFSKILLNFSLEAPNSGSGSSISVFVDPFFFLLNVVIHNENKLYLHNKEEFYKDILKEDSMNSYEDSLADD